ncbi:MAG: hypothetical protein B6D58_08560 [candidate division Zixibacteria bacterium 4484_95]|nr:MAG: hypothetical protein B6D58_08560 [candidate division Zixibacteria bacterium 4484_95]
MRITLRFFIVVLCSNLAFGSMLPVGRPDTRISYDYLRELYLRGYVDAQAALFIPVDYRYISGLSLEGIPPMFDKLTKPLAYLDRRFHNELEGLKLNLSVVPYGLFNGDVSKSYFAFYPGANYKISPNLFIDIAYRIDSGLNDDSLYTGKRWSEFAGYGELAMISYRTKRLSIGFGRRRCAWGVARKGKTLMLSATAMPLDGLFIDYRIRKTLSFHSTIACLSPIKVDSLFLESGHTENRYFSAHALMISPVKWLDFVLKESVVYGGFGRRFEPYYAMPLLWFHAEQLNANIDDNTFFGIETVIRLKNRYAGYLELLIDDYQIEKKTASDYEPNEIGFIAGVDIFDFPVRMGFMELEYTRINNRTYNQMKPRNRYVNQNYPLGHPLGPDNESVNLSYTYHIKRGLTGGFIFYVLNRGEGRINNDWETPWIDDSTYSEKFPSGVVEKRLGGQFELLFHRDSFLQARIACGVADIKNKGNIPGVDETDWSIEFEIILSSPGIVLRFNDN